jgi:hypothetical protein
MAFDLADRKILEARQQLTALDRELMALARIVGDDRAPMEERVERGRILQERLKAFLELLELLELADMPPEEMAGPRIRARRAPTLYSAWGGRTTSIR